MRKKVLVLDIHKVAIVFSPFCAHCANATIRNGLSLKIMSSFSEKGILLTYWSFSLNCETAHNWLTSRKYYTKVCTIHTIHRFTVLRSVAYAENFHGGVLVQGHMVVICIWCALFVTSQFDVMSCFQTNVLAKFVDKIMHIFLHALPLFHVSLHWMWTISVPS